MIVTEADRQAARTDREHKPKMSDKAKEKLRAQAEADKRDEVEEARIFAEFMRLRRDVPNLANAIYQITGAQPRITRMAQKLLASLDAGLLPTLRHASSDIVFLATLTPDEEKMSDEEFVAELRRHASMKHKVRDSVRPKRGSLQEKQRQMRKRAIQNGQPVENVSVPA